jgi:drug/metabolite transporter (DMT)-like permease
MLAAPGQPSGLDAALTLTVSLAVLLAALLHAGWNAMIKGGRDVLLESAGIVLGAGVVALPFAFVLPLPPTGAWLYIAGSLTIHLAYYTLMVNAYRVGDLSLVYPLMRGVAPLITGVAGIFLLRELPSAYGWFGMLLISLGVLALALRAPGHAPSRTATGFALANAAVIAAYTLVDGKGARVSTNAWSYIVWLFVLDTLPFSLYMLARHRVRFIQFLRANSGRALIGGGLSAGAYAIAVWAMTQAPVALVASLRETSVLFATLLGARVLKEQLSPRRWAGVIAVAVGVIALKIA